MSRPIEAFAAWADKDGDVLIEAQVTGGTPRIFAITELADCRAPELAADEVLATAVDGPHQVRLVGAELPVIKAARSIRCPGWFSTAGDPPARHRRLRGAGQIGPAPIRRARQ